LNNGVISLAGDAALQLTAGRTLTNAVGAVFSLDGSADSTVLGVFDNLGVFNKNSAGVQTFGSSLGSFVNLGTVNVLAGELHIAGSGVDSGTYAIGAGTTLAFTGGTRTLAAGSTIGGDGSLVLSGGSIDLNGDLPIAGGLSLQGAAVNLDTPGTGVNLSAGLALSGGSLVTADDIVTPNLAWTGGTLSGSGSLETTGTGSVIGAAGTRLLQIDWLNSGTHRWRMRASCRSPAPAPCATRASSRWPGPGGSLPPTRGLPERRDPDQDLRRHPIDRADELRQCRQRGDIQRAAEHRRRRRGYRHLRHRRFRDPGLRRWRPQHHRQRRHDLYRHRRAARPGHGALSRWHPELCRRRRDRQRDGVGPGRGPGPDRAR
jgi:hypothetical protein